MGSPSLGSSPSTSHSQSLMSRRPRVRLIVRDPAPETLDSTPCQCSPERYASASVPGQHIPKRKRRGSDTDSEYSPAISLRGGGRPQKARGKNTPSSQTTQSQALQTSRRTTRSKARRAGSPSDLITTSLEDIKVEDASVRSEISRLGLTLRDVQGDGNCLFRCLSDQLYGTEKRHSEMRRIVCDYLDSHKDTMEGFVVPFMKDKEGYQGYVQRMRQSKQFGSHIEIQAAARMFRRDIRVVMSTASFTIPWRSEPPSPSERPLSHLFSSESSPSTATDAVLENVPPMSEGRTMVWLALFSQAEHFQSIRRRGDKENGTAGVEDRLAVPHQKDTSEAARRARGELVEDLKPNKDQSTLLSQLLASLPRGNSVTLLQAKDVLARVKGDLGEAVEILLEDIASNIEGLSEASSDKHVEEMLREQPFHEGSHGLGSLAAADQMLEVEKNTYREPAKTSISPAPTSTTGTRSRSCSSSEGDRPRTDSVTSDDVEHSTSSGCTSLSEGRGSRHSPTKKRLGRDVLVRSTKLGRDLEEMALGSREGAIEKKVTPTVGSKRREGLRSRNKV